MDNKPTKEKSRLFENFISLSILQGVNYLIPLITLPYLVRVLGPTKFGLIVFAEAFIQYFNILTDYGFNLSATREISINRKDKKKICEIFSSVIIIKSALLLLSFIIMTIIIFCFERFKKDWIIYYLTFGMVVGQSLFPIWFFQGMERMKYITFLNTIGKLIFTISIFIFVHKISDYIYVPIINSLSCLVSGNIAIWIVMRCFKVSIYIPNLLILSNYLKNSIQFFLSRVSVSLYTTSNTFVIGLFLGNKMVGFYSAAEKIFNAIVMLYQPLNDSLYPLMSRRKSSSFFKKIFWLVVIINFIICILLYFVSPLLIKVLYGANFYISGNLLKIFSILGIIIVPSIILGYPFVAAMGYPQYANLSVIIASIVHIIVLFSIIPVLNVYLVAFLLIQTQLIVLGIRIYGIKKHHLWEK